MAAAILGQLAFTSVIAGELDPTRHVAEIFAKDELFDTHRAELYRETLQLLAKRQVRLQLRDDLQLRCELKRYRAPDQDRELGIKVGLHYRF